MRADSRYSTSEQTSYRCRVRRLGVEVDWGHGGEVGQRDNLFYLIDGLNKTLFSLQWLCFCLHITLNFQFNLTFVVQKLAITLKLCLLLKSKRQNL